MVLKDMWLNGPLSMLLMR